MPAQQHLDRLSAVDAAFLAQEKPNRYMHIGGVARFEGTPPALDELLAHVESRLPLVPRYRQKLAFPPLDTGRPIWIDDPTFNLGYHVRHSALPEPGDEGQLMQLVGRLFAQRLDRSKPLWEASLVEGLSDGGFALISKVHHSLVDGISGLDLTSVLFDLQPAVAAPPHPAEPWVPHPEPTPATLAAQGLQGAVRRVTGVATGALDAATHPGALAGRAREVAEGIGEVALAGLSSPPETPFNVTPGPHRRVAVVRADLAEFKLVKDTFGGTVNDVVLTVVAGGLAYFLQTRGLVTGELELKAAVPVSVRGPEHQGALGNQLTQMVAPLPLFLEDPLARLRYVRNAMTGIKESKQALGAEAIAALQGFAPPTILAQASRLNFAGRFYNLLVTNIPGPQFPLYLLGRRLRELVPIAFLAGRRALAIAILSYDGALTFGLLGDYDALPDLDVVAEGIEGAIAELVGLAQKQQRMEQRRAPRRKPRAPAKKPG